MIFFSEVKKIHNIYDITIKFQTKVRYVKNKKTGFTKIKLFSSCYNI